MPYENNAIFLKKSKFALLFQHTTENNYGKQRQHLIKKKGLCTMNTSNWF